EVISGINRITLKWESVGEVVGYAVYRTPVFPGEAVREVFRTIETGDPEQYIDWEVETEVIYTYSIRAIDRAGNCSDFTESLMAQLGTASETFGKDGGTIKFEGCEIVIGEKILEEESYSVVISEAKEDLPENI